jgi:hypothetical protein
MVYGGAGTDSLTYAYDGIFIQGPPSSARTGPRGP